MLVVSYDIHNHALFTKIIENFSANSNLIFQSIDEYGTDFLDATSKQDCLTECRKKQMAKGCEFFEVEEQCTVYYNDVNSVDSQTGFACWILAKCK